MNFDTMDDDIDIMIYLNKIQGVSQSTSMTMEM